MKDKIRIQFDVDQNLYTLLELSAKKLDKPLTETCRKAMEFYFQKILND